jgi:periplasmic divalent cation tolerance protein
VLVTAATKKEAEKISKAILRKRLAACVNIVPGLTSFFHWKGKIEKANEFLLLIKTQSELFTDLEKTVKTNHGYSVPEIIAMPITKSSKDYLAWIKKETGQKLSKK